MVSSPRGHRSRVNRPWAWGDLVQSRLTPPARKWTGGRGQHCVVITNVNWKLSCFVKATSLRSVWMQIVLLCSVQLSLNSVLKKWVNFQFKYLSFEINFIANATYQWHANAQTGNNWPGYENVQQFLGETTEQGTQSGHEPSQNTNGPGSVLDAHGGHQRGYDSSTSPCNAHHPTCKNESW